MTRGKVKLQLIAKDSERRVSFRKRKKGLLKKLDEITTLCDVDACAIISSPFEANMEVWPSHVEAQRVITRFRDMAPTDQNKKMFNLETFTKERIMKVTEQVRKLRIDNRRMELDQIISQSLATGILDYQNNPQLLNEIDQALRQNLQEVNMRIQTLRGKNPVLETKTGVMQVGEGSGRRNMTLENITNGANFMASGSGGGGGGEEPIFPNNDAAPGFI